MKQTMMEILRSLCPVLVTGGIVLCCATAPVLTAVPERLNWIPSVEAARESEPAQRETASPEPELEPEPSNGEAEPARTAAAEYQDGSFIGVGTGFGGEIKVEVRVEQGRIAGIEILSAPGETESFLSRARAVIDRILSAQSWEVDAVSGATYSSNGIKAAVKNALNGEREETAPAPARTAIGGGNPTAPREVKFEAPEGGYRSGSYIGSAQGFGGLITVRVKVQDGRIIQITVCAAPGETPSFLERAKAVIPAILQGQSPNVDAVSGATYSSRGIINAVKAALRQAGNGTLAASGSPRPESEPGKASGKEKDETPTQTEPAEPESEPGVVYADGIYTGIGTGFGGPIRVEIKIQRGQMTDISVLEAQGETTEFLQKAEAVIERVLKSQSPEVDAVAGATFSSNGILEAVANALKTASAGTVAPTPTPAEPSEPEEPAPSEPEEPAPSEPGVVYADGIYTGIGTGFGGPIRVEIKIQRGQMTDISVLEAQDETPEFLQKAEAVIERVLKAQSPEVDAVAGATFSSNGILEAVANALKTASAGTVAPTPTPAEPSEPEEPAPSEPEEFTETYTGTAMVLADENEEFWDYEILLTVTVLVKQRLVEENGQQQSVTERCIADVTLDADTEATNLAFLNRAFQVIRRQLLEQKTEFDAVSGATCSSIGIRNAWEQILRTLNLTPGEG